MDSLKMKNIKEEIIDLARNDIGPIVITIILVNHILFLKHGLITAKYENLTEKI